MVEAKALLKSFLEPYRTAGSASMTQLDDRFIETPGKEIVHLPTEECVNTAPEKSMITKTLRTLTALLEDVRNKESMLL